MVPEGHAGCSEEVRRGQTSRATRCKAGETTFAPLRRGEAAHNRRRDHPAPCSRLHHGGFPPGLGGEPSPGAKEEQHMAIVYQLH